MELINSLDDEQIDALAKALAHYVFRNGVVEDIHSEGRLSQDDMKRLNKDVHNRIAGLLVALHDDRMVDILKLIALYANYGDDWDRSEPYLDEFNLM